MHLLDQISHKTTTNHTQVAVTAKYIAQQKYLNILTRLDCLPNMAAGFQVHTMGPEFIKVSANLRQRTTKLIDEDRACQNGQDTA